MQAKQRSKRQTTFFLDHLQALKCLAKKKQNNKNKTESKTKYEKGH